MILIIRLYLLSKVINAHVLILQCHASTSLLVGGFCTVIRAMVLELKEVQLKCLNPLIKVKNLDKQMVLDYLQRQDPRRTYPLYHAPLIPTFAGDIDIFELKQLEKIKVETRQSQGGLYIATVPL